MMIIRDLVVVAAAVAVVFITTSGVASASTVTAVGRVAEVEAISPFCFEMP
jgi:hypothetical protein